MRGGHGSRCWRRREFDGGTFSVSSLIMVVFDYVLFYDHQSRANGMGISEEANVAYKFRSSVHPEFDIRKQMALDGSHESTSR
jgi:hypothetical protein